MRPAALSAAVVASLSLLVVAAPAVATTDVPNGPRGEIVRVDRTSRGLAMVFQATNLPSGSTVDLSSVRVTVDNRAIDARSSPVTEKNNLSRTTVLAIDTSASMGTRLDDAKTAAHLYVRSLPRDVRIGVVSFDVDVATEQSLTRNHVLVDAAIDRLALSPRNGTSLFDAVLKAVGVSGGGGSSSVLLVTDGKNSRTSTKTKDDAISGVANSDTRAAAVYIGPGATVPNDLVDLVGDENVFRADPEELAAIYRDAARSIASQIRVRIDTPPDLVGRPVNIVVRARAGNLRLTDDAQSAFGLPPPDDVGPQPAGPGLAARLAPAGVLPVALVLVFGSLMALLALAFTQSEVSGGDSGRLRRRLSFYTLAGRQGASPERPASTVLGRSTVARGAVDLAGRIVSQRDVEALLGRRLEAAGLPLRAAEWILIHAGCTFGLAIFLLLVSGGNVVPALLGLFLGAVLPWLYLSLAESRRTSAFMAQLPETLQLISGSLSAGYSLPQALDTVVREGQQPMTAEFNRALVETRLGVPIEDALDGVAERMASKDFAWVVMAYKIQREVGGNLAELLATLAETMRERDALRRQVRALSAEGRLSGWILGLLPPVFSIYLLTTRPAYLKPLVTDPLGILLISVGAVLLIVGALWMRKAVKVEV